MIPASLLIIIVPLAAAVPAYILRRWRVIEVIIAALACSFIVGLLARPVDSTLNISVFTISTSAPVNLLGRVLAVRPTDHLPLLLLFAIALVFFLLSLIVAQGWTFVPLGLVILALVSIGLLIRPFVFAALAFEAAAAVAAIMIQAERSGQESTRGAMRYLIVTSLALPAFLGAGYAITLASNITDPALQAGAYNPPAILLGIGLGLLFGALPLFTWTHSVARDAPPLTTAFLATVSIGAVTFFFLSLKQDFTWVRDSADISSICNLFGIAMLLFGGILGWAQRSFGRVLACGISVEIGSTLLLLNHNNPLSVEAIAFSTAARALSLGVLAIGMALIREQAGSDEFSMIGGLGRRQVWGTLAIAVGGLSLAGLPGTIGFVSRWTTARVLGQTDLEILVLTLLAGASVGAGVVRGLAALYGTANVMSARSTSSAIQRRTAVAIVATTALLIVLGITPGITAPVTKAIAENYTYYR
ncbi:MAG: hypothetical protein M1434_06300 [Chloroflexi bacterium]|nr:hypothetical protein [Chloroflexota bacterium]MCL5274346.1 hypothetical protein [Chloroflexota bacterium]